LSRTIQEWSHDLQDTAKSELWRTIRKEFTRAKVLVENEAKLNATTGPKVRSGRLRASIKSEVIEGRDRIRLTVGANTPYAAIQEFGGRISGNPYLAIPLAAARTMAGDIKAEFAGGWRGVPGVFVLQAGPKLFLVRRESGSLEFLAVLKRSVTLKGHKYLERAMVKTAKMTEKRLAQAISKLLEDGP
jgi:phage gpG-like protein